MDLQGKTVLVVDDEEALREIMAEELSLKNANALCAENGTRALELLKSNKVDAVISDVRMPGGSGLDLIRGIVESLNYQPKLFIFSGYKDVSADQAKTLGVIEIFPKPFEIRQIIKAVQDSLAS